MLLDKRNLAAKGVNGGGIDSSSLFYISNSNGQPATSSLGSGIIAMQSSTTTPRTTTMLPNEFITSFTNPLANNSPIKFEPIMPIENNIASFGPISQAPVVPPPGHHPHPMATTKEPSHSLPMQLVQTTINPNGMSKESSNKIQYQAQIPQPSQQQSKLQIIQQPNLEPTMSSATTNNWSEDASRRILEENVNTLQQTSPEQEVTDEKQIPDDVNSPTSTDIDIGELYDDVMQCVYDDVQADGDEIDLIFDKPPTPPERIRSSTLEANCVLPEVIERPLPEKPPQKPSMIARFGKKGFLSGKGKNGKKKQDDVDVVNKVNNAGNTQQIAGFMSTDAAPCETILPKNKSVPFFQRLFNRSKSQTEEELNFQNQSQRSSVIISDFNNTDIPPTIPTHVGNNESISDTMISEHNTNGSDLLIPNGTSISNENAIFELLDENLTVNDLT